MEILTFKILNQRLDMYKKTLKLDRIALASSVVVDGIIGANMYYDKANNGLIRYISFGGTIVITGFNLVKLLIDRHQYKNYKIIKDAVLKIEQTLSNKDEVVAKR